MILVFNSYTMFRWMKYYFHYLNYALNPFVKADFVSCHEMKSISLIINQVIHIATRDEIFMSVSSDCSPRAST